MECREFKDRITIWFDRVLQEGESNENIKLDPPEDLLAHAEHCTRCSSHLGTILALLGTSRPGSVPTADLESQIIAKLDQKTRPQRSISPIFVPAAAAAAAAAAVIIFTLLFILPAGTDNPQEVVVRFYLEAPAASTVALVGDWNDWDGEAHLLRDIEGDGVWETEIRLIPGREYRYQFFIDGKEWIADPGAPLSVDDGFGGKNSVLQL